jgi:hypothetical protein
VARYFEDIQFALSSYITILVISDSLDSTTTRTSRPLKLRTWQNPTTRISATESISLSYKVYGGCFPRYKYRTKLELGSLRISCVRLGINKLERDLFEAKRRTDCIIIRVDRYTTANRDITAKMTKFDACRVSLHTMFQEFCDASDSSLLWKSERLSCEERKFKLRRKSERLNSE